MKYFCSFSSGGTFGTSTVTYTYTDGTAQNPSDYTINTTALTFSPGEEQKFIQVQIVDDKLSEFQETFRLDLTGISGPAALGAITRINITIETSDNPYGLFGMFNTSLSISVVNPNVSRVISFPVYRKDGALSSSEVTYKTSSLSPLLLLLFPHIHYCWAVFFISLNEADA